MPLPIPRVAPVTTATFPAKETSPKAIEGTVLFFTKSPPFITLASPLETLRRDFAFAQHPPRRAGTGEVAETALDLCQAFLFGIKALCACPPCARPLRRCPQPGHYSRAARARSRHAVRYQVRRRGLA